MKVVMISDEKVVTKALRKELNDLKKKAEKELVAKAKKAAKAQAEKELLKAISICFSLLSIDLLL